MADLGWTPKGIILSGSPYSVYDDDAPRVDPAVFDQGVPVFGICYGLQVRSIVFSGINGVADFFVLYSSNTIISNRSKQITSSHLSSHIFIAIALVSLIKTPSRKSPN